MLKERTNPDKSASDVIIPPWVLQQAEVRERWMEMGDGRNEKKESVQHSRPHLCFFFFLMVVCVGSSSSSVCTRVFTCSPD